ncbi:MAG: PaaI family thioesterase [Lachnospiraceae bacterium]|nr:PaaI family thioesterase [Lachnospiraceae bacterium]
MDDRVKQELKKLVTHNIYAEAMGIELLELRQGYARGRMPYRLENANPYGSLHGGALYSLADIICGLAACTYGYYSSTIEGSMHYVRPALNTRYVICEAHELRQGRQVSVYEARLTNDEGLLLDTAEFSFYMLEKEV